jgi:N-acyl-D-aspartate/D-glutamate deacylase
MHNPRSVGFVLALAVLSGCDSAGAEFDLILQGGTVVDGTGRAPYPADVGIVGGSIAQVGDLSGARIKDAIDVGGLIVAPGFINLHSHARLQGLPTAANMLTQGVTTEIINADGGGPLDLSAQLAEAQAAGLALNVGTNVAFNSIWSSVNGPDDRRPSAEQIAEMSALVEAGLEQGAWGIAAGLDYKPTYYALVEDITDVLSEVRRWRTLFTNHDRVRPETGFSSRVGMAETIEIGEATGTVPVITHMKIQGREQGSVEEVLAMMREATSRGVYTAADAYPYLAGQTSLAALIIPGWAQEGGQDAARARFRDPALRARIIAEADEAIAARFGGPEGVYLPDTQRELTDVMVNFGVGSGGDAVVRMLEEQNPTAILRFGSESDLTGILRHPTTSVSCDCDATPGPAAHPRGYGTFPRVLGRYVREEGVLTLEDAVRKMTGLPATTIGLVDRGFVSVGMAADLTVFDPETVIDHSTYEDPTAPSEGIVHVVVNGVMALRDGVVMGVQAGTPLVRSPNLPARAMELDIARSVAFEGLVTPVEESGRVPFQLSIDVEQGSGDATASGTFRAWGEDGRELTAVSLGLLQTAEMWAGFTARLRDENGVERSASIVIDPNDPFSPGGATLRITLEGTTPVVAHTDAEVTISR